MPLQTFADFWPYYVRAHSRATTRMLHAIGSILVLVCLVLALSVSPWFLLAAPVIGYSFAWYSHFFVEHNKPATFGHPFYSLVADYLMLWKILTGQMSREVARHCEQS